MTPVVAGRRMRRYLAQLAVMYLLQLPGIQTRDHRHLSFECV